MSPSSTQEGGAEVAEGSRETQRAQYENITNDLALPNELLHKILLAVICDSVHTICISPGDTTWEKGMVETLHQVSPTFEAIATELVAKAFDLPKTTRSDDAR